MEVKRFPLSFCRTSYRKYNYCHLGWLAASLFLFCSVPCCRLQTHPREKAWHPCCLLKLELSSPKIPGCQHVLAMLSLSPTERNTCSWCGLANEMLSALGFNRHWRQWASSSHQGDKFEHMWLPSTASNYWLIWFSNVCRDWQEFQARVFPNQWHH